ncbi:MAG: DUF4174 domain-containing protein [Acidobacteriaceae bacterium]|nr:DUF4174 domain-containing protein [Acidobacteriaceae bacterium]
MKIASILLAAATLSPALALTAYSQTVQPAGLTSLQDLHDRARVLLVFAPRPDDPQLQIQLRSLNEQAAEATDRELVTVALPYNAPSPTPATFPAQEAYNARRRFQIAPGDFTVVLIGKDGGEKLRAHKPLSMRELNDTIDSMPMRQHEVAARHK